MWLFTSIKYNGQLLTFKRPNSFKFHQERNKTFLIQQLYYTTYMITTYVISGSYKSYSLIKPTYIIFSEYDYRCLSYLVRLGSDKNCPICARWYLTIQSTIRPKFFKSRNNFCVIMISCNILYRLFFLKSIAQFFTQIYMN